MATKKFVMLLAIGSLLTPQLGIGCKPGAEALEKMNSYVQKPSTPGEFIAQAFFDIFNEALDPERDVRFLGGDSSILGKPQLYKEVIGTQTLQRVRYHHAPCCAECFAKILNSFLANFFIRCDVYVINSGQTFVGDEMLACAIRRITRELIYQGLKELGFFAHMVSALCNITLFLVRHPKEWATDPIVATRCFILSEALVHSLKSKMPDEVILTNFLHLVVNYTGYMTAPTADIVKRYLQGTFLFCPQALTMITGFLGRIGHQKGRDTLIGLPFPSGEVISINDLFHWVQTQRAISGSIFKPSPWLKANTEAKSAKKRSKRLRK